MLPGGRRSGSWWPWLGAVLSQGPPRDLASGLLSPCTSLIALFSLPLQPPERHGAGSRLLLAAGGPGGRGDRPGRLHAVPRASQEQVRAALRPATPASPFPCVQLVPAGKSSSPPASIAGPVRPDVPAPAAGSILGTSRAAGDPSLGAERLTPVFYSVHVFLMFVFMLKPECCSIRGADTSRPQQAVLVPSGLHFPLLGKAAREGWGCSLPKPHFWGLSWPLLLGRRSCSP